MIWPNNSPAPTHAHLPAILSSDDVAEIVRYGQMSAAAAKARGDLSGFGKDGTVRMRPQGPSAFTNRIAKQIWDAVKVVNAEHFHFDIIGVEHWQYIEYPAGSGAGSHIDQTYGYKLSVSVQLSSPGEYDGGDLRLLWGTSIAVVADRAPGHGIVFPSYALHEVTPVTRGVRKALVAWCLGPAFR